MTNTPFQAEISRRSRSPRPAGRPSRAALNSAGFSLIELLVVIVVVAVLIGLGLTGLRSARDAARSVACAANLRAMGVALIRYYDEQKELLPLADPTGLIQIRVGDVRPFDTLADELNVPLPRIENGEIITPDAFRCPSDFDKWRKVGVSYGYPPAVWMWASEAADPIRQATIAFMRSERRQPLFVDLGPFHDPAAAGDPKTKPLAGRNAVNQRSEAGPARSVLDDL